MTAAVLIMTFLAFTLSASAGLGGSLILVPAMAMMLGPKSGIAMASAMLALNNVGKVIAYRRDIPIGAAGLVILMTIIGSMVGASVIIQAPEHWVGGGVVAMILGTFAIERFAPREIGRSAALPLAFLAGGTSGFSGTSGPLKGIAIRSLRLRREHFVGAASAVSLAGDGAKVLVYADGSLFPPEAETTILAAIPLMIVAVPLGRRINNAVGERGYAALFWAVMAGYSVRLAAL